MTSWPSGAPRARRHQLAAELRRARTLAGWPAGTWPRPPGSASPPSPGPNADKPFSPGGTAWTDATRITGDRRAVLLALAEAAVNEVATFRIRLSSGLAAAQDSVRDLEASARVVWQVGCPAASVVAGRRAGPCRNSRRLASVPAPAQIIRVGALPRPRPPAPKPRRSAVRVQHAAQPKVAHLGIGSSRTPCGPGAARCSSLSCQRLP